MPTALVTGATGFIGRALVPALQAAGYTVRALVRPTSNRADLDARGVTCVEGDIARPESLEVGDADVVFHLASLLKMPWKPAFEAVNVAGTGNVAAACAAAQRPPRLIVVSSLAAAGPSDTPRTEADPDAPVSIYGRVKLAAEAAALAHADRVPVIIARPPMVLGPGDASGLKLFRSVARGWHLVPGRGDRRVSLIFVDDLAQGLITLARAGAPQDGGRYYLAAPDTPTWAELGRSVAAALGREARVVRVPRPILWTAAAISQTIARLRDRPTFLNLDKYRESQAGSWICSAHKARELGFETGDTATALTATAADYRDRGWL